MPQPYPAVPLRPMLSRFPRRAAVLAASSCALAFAGASTDARADTPPNGGGAEAGAAPATAPEPAATPAPAAPLSRSIIRAAQRRLHVRPDGALGPRTRAALRRFQKRHQLTVDGRLGAATLAALGVTGRAASVTPAGPPATGEAGQVLAEIAQCESAGDPTRVSANGRYRGKYQFDTDTWEAAGGAGDPAAAPEAEQDGRAASLFAAEGTAPWPVCGPKAVKSVKAAKA